MFPVYINDGTQELPKNDIFYIVAKEGIFLKKKMGIMESLAPVSNISILESISTSAKMHIPKIPGQSFAKVLEFFKEVQNQYNSEAIVLIFYNEETKKFKFLPPKQEVSGASVDYNRSISIDSYTMIGDIHSHSNFSAFHSGIDDSDEKTFDGLHITIGHVDQDEVSISASIVANGHRFMVDPSEYVLSIELTKDDDETAVGYTSRVYKYEGGKMVLDENASKKYTYRKMDKRYISTITESKRRFNKEWMKLVEHKPYVSTLYGGKYGYISGRYFKDGKVQPFNSKTWNNHYDPHAWQQFRKVGEKPPKEAVIPDAPEVVTIEAEEELCPCQMCKFRDEKLEIEHNDDLIEMYECGKCGTIIMDSEDLEEITCEKCGTDDYLIFIDPDKLESKFEDAPTIKCKVCENEFIKEENMVLCPFCYELLPIDEIEFSAESERQIQMIVDSGDMLDSEAEEANQEAISQINEKIPDPKKDEIPITVIKENKETSRLRKLFANVFGEKA